MLEEKTKFGIINDLFESKLFRSSNRLSRFSAKDLADLTYIYFLSLALLAQEKETEKFASQYAETIIKWGNFDNFNLSGSDLYIMLHALFGKNNDRALKTLKQPDSSARFAKSLHFPYMIMKAWIRTIMRHDMRDEDVRRFLLKLEPWLKISDGGLMQARRRITYWKQNDNFQEKLSILTRLERELRSKATLSEIRRPLQLLLRKYHKLSQQISEETKIEENAAGGSTAAGAIAPVAKSFFQVISRTSASNKKKKTKNKKKSDNSDK